ncbi:hypothetical protein EK21DRAFT_73386, partial [Setomelanomma holmii]
EYPLHGCCPCSHVNYTLTSAPIIVHACHCTHCQRETGTAFAFNAFYEPDRVVVTLSTGETGPEAEERMFQSAVPSLKGGIRGQIMSRCPKCFSTLWSSYTAGSALKIVRAGTIDGVVDEQGRYVPCGGLRPDAHIYVASACGWVNLESERVYQGMGVKDEYWSKESLERFEKFTTGKRSAELV